MTHPLTSATAEAVDAAVVAAEDLNLTCAKAEAGDAAVVAAEDLLHGHRFNVPDTYMPRGMTDDNLRINQVITCSIL
jgi:hypothetical protein